MNTVEMVSPHHSAKEIMTNLKEGQITSLFQKSLKRVSERPAMCQLSGTGVERAIDRTAVYFKAIVPLLLLSLPAPPLRRLST